jgi:hypothetical protein
MEDRIFKEVLERINVFNKMPMYYENFIYFMKDNKIY